MMGALNPLAETRYQKPDPNGFRNQGSDPNNRCSQSSYILMLAARSVTWTLQLQRTIALSSTEAEYMTLSDCCKQVVWVQSLLNELGFKVTKTPIIGDNQGSLFLASNPVAEKRTKHIDIRYHHIRQRVDDGEVELLHAGTDDQIADILTKNLSHIKFNKHRENLGL